MRKILFAGLGGFAIAAVYAASPFVTAWNIREAIHNGDANYLEKKIEWDSVRASLRASLAMPGQAPAAEAVAARPGLWARIKTRIGERAVEAMVSKYVTPEGLPLLLGYRQIYRTHITGEAREPKPPLATRIANFWQRVKRAEFRSPAALEVEIADRNDPGRHYVALLRLQGFQWKLTELSVKFVDVASLPAKIRGG